MKRHLYMLHVFTVMAALVTYGDTQGTDSSCDGVRKCPCYSHPPHVLINCSAMDLTVIPSSFPKEFYSLDFSNNLITPQRIHDLCRYKLHAASLAGNHLSKLPIGQFIGCDVIDTLDLSGNMFDELSNGSLSGLQSLRSLLGLEARAFKAGVFTNLTSLRQLQITVNQFQIPSDLLSELQLERLELTIETALDIPAQLLVGVQHTLNSLTITSASLQWIGTDLLSPLTNLKDFTLDCPRLRYIPDSLFSGNTALRTLSLSVTSVPRNLFRGLNMTSLRLQRLEDMPSELFAGLFFLKTLEVSQSVIPRIPGGWFLDLYRLKSLTLTDNGIQTLTEEDFKNLHSLTHLDLSRNSIRELRNGVIADIAETVKHVSLSHNLLKIITFKNLASAVGLETLNLNNNQIYRIEPGAFQDLYELRTLNLGGNKLSSIPADSFASNGLLSSLDLSSNIFSSIPAGLFEPTPALRLLDLSGNVLWATGPASAYPTHSMSRLDLSYNPLTCDCDSYELVLSMPASAEVAGDCREPGTGTSIRDYRPDIACSGTTSTTTFASRQPAATPTNYHSASASEQSQSSSASTLVTDTISALKSNTLLTTATDKSSTTDTDFTPTDLGSLTTATETYVDGASEGYTTQTTASDRLQSVVVRSVTDIPTTEADGHIDSVDDEDSTTPGIEHLTSPRPNYGSLSSTTVDNTYSKITSENSNTQTHSVVRFATDFPALTTSTDGHMDSVDDENRAVVGIEFATADITSLTPSNTILGSKSVESTYITSDNSNTPTYKVVRSVTDGHIDRLNGDGDIAGIEPVDVEYSSLTPINGSLETTTTDSTNTNGDFSNTPTHNLIHSVTDFQALPTVTDEYKDNVNGNDNDATEIEPTTANYFSPRTSNESLNSSTKDSASHSPNTPANNASIPGRLPNLTLDSGEVIADIPVTKESHRVAVGSIVGVALVCLLLIVLLVYKRRRRSRYELNQASQASEITRNVDIGPALQPLKEVPSIQIETVDALDNVKVELYQPQ